MVDHKESMARMRELVEKWRREADRLRAINAEMDPDGKTFRYAECLREENAAQAGALTSCARALEAALAQQPASCTACNDRREVGGATLSNPWTGKPRDYRDVNSDPEGVLCVEPGAPLKAATGVEGLTTKEAWWAGARAGLGVPADMPRTEVAALLPAVTGGASTTSTGPQERSHCKCSRRNSII